MSGGAFDYFEYRMLDAANEIQNAVIQVLASAPSSPVAGQIYYNSSSGRIEFRNGSGWIEGPRTCGK
jgi:hypothetical protein